MKHIHALSKCKPAPARLPNPNVPPKVDLMIQSWEILFEESPKLQIKIP